jgi:hypothetical protein
LSAKIDGAMAGDPVVDWLLEPEQPAVRARAFTELLGRPESDRDVRRAVSTVGSVGWGAEILAARDPAGWWAAPRTLYEPKYQSTLWRMLVLADLGLTRDDPAVRASCELWFEREQKADGGFGPDTSRLSHLCTTGNAARALIQFGYGDDARVRRALDWLVAAAAPKGGWSCWGSGRNLDSWEPLTAFAEYPRERWTPEMAGVVERGAEFFLSRELHRQGEPYEPWFRTHYPRHYYYDVLVGLDALTALGYGADVRLDLGLKWLRERRRRDGRWVLDALHPDVAGGMAEWLAAHPKQRPTPFAVEPPGAPSKIITLTARRVLRRVELARGAAAAPAGRAARTPRAASRGSSGGAGRSGRRRARTT